MPFKVFKKHLLKLLRDNLYIFCVFFGPLAASSLCEELIAKQKAARIELHDAVASVAPRFLEATRL